MSCSSLQKASGLVDVPGSDDNKKKAVLELRRVLILALVGATPKTNPSLDPILEAGYLKEVYGWLEDILKGSVGAYFAVYSFLVSLVVSQSHLFFLLQAVLICCFIF